ncbi:hypothetical protein H5410_053235 [Solanum commersonii]|uniref:Uncharacterized protein n=1 Tax=Solanum commersonii TaxID=4109 RepID=A0A9J5X6H6_SOLCO|nr:hypothetical protein H5410_053235 [Solanum commersonii]
MLHPAIYHAPLINVQKNTRRFINNDGDGRLTSGDVIQFFAMSNLLLSELKHVVASSEFIFLVHESGRSTLLALKNM